MREAKTIYTLRKPADFTKTKYRIPQKSSNLWTLFNNLLNLLAKKSEIRIWQRKDREGNTWWNAYDPHTDKSIQLSSEAEMRVWIEQRYYD